MDSIINTGEDSRMKVTEKLYMLRQKMREHGLQAYIVPTDDFHGSEYVGEHFKTREYMSGFTGSAGTLVVTESEARLWTDGRYFLQAEAQLQGSTIALMKMGEPGVEDIPVYLAANLPEGARIGFDGRTMTTAFAGKIRAKTDELHMVLVPDRDLCGEIWADRPAISAGHIWELKKEYTGQDRRDKLRILREKMREKGADDLLVSALDEIAWLLNLRGSDIDYTPVFLSYMLIRKEDAVLFIQEGVLSEDIRRALSRDNIQVAGYDEVYAWTEKIPERETIWMDGSTANYRLVLAAEKKHALLMEESPVLPMKGTKNSTEIRGMKEANVRDGVAVTRLMRWLKTRVGKGEITELDVVHKLEEYHRRMEGYLEESFAPIIAYAEHGAIIHYEPDDKSNKRIEPHGLCLTDTGAQYMCGTTDVSRTIVMGEVTPEEKRMFTLVLKGHLRLSTARFKYGVCGENLDYLARGPLWAEGLDYNHGTGHGVGSLLGVHEGTQRISWKIRQSAPTVPFEAGMVVTNEPGVYLEGKFGIRHENMLLCCEDKQTDYGRFLRFENLTMVPFDRDGIALELLTEEERKTLNAYHATVYEKLSPWFTGEENEWLREATKPLVRSEDSDE